MGRRESSIGVLYPLSLVFRLSGGIGIRGGLKHHWETLWVRVPPQVPIVTYGSLVQKSRTPPCHGGGQGFESPTSRHCLSVAKKNR